MKNPTELNKSFYGFAVGVLVIIGILGFLSLRNGFSGDQALFLIYSKAISNGAIYYKDVWDIKQPAVIFFYLVGGKLFGFTEIGIHLLELIYWLSFSFLLIFGLRNYFSNPLFAALTPLFTIGIYYTVSGSLHFTQVEGLVGFPLFLSIWFCQKFLENPKLKRYLFLSGLFGGVVLTFKLLLGVLLAGFWVCFFVYFFGSKINLRKLLEQNVLILSGIIIPVSLFFAYFWINGALEELWYATFVYPTRAVATVVMNERDFQLKTGLVWFFKSYFPVISLTTGLLILSIISPFSDWRGKIKTIFRIENYLYTALFIWIVLGLSVILIQKLSWWEYHYSLPMIPLGILAVKCLERVLGFINGNLKTQYRAIAYAGFAILLLLFFVPTSRRFAQKVREFREPELIRIGDREVLVTGSALGDYKSISADTKFFVNENPRPPIFIVSNPLYYYLSDSAPTFASNGAMSDMFTDIEWKRLDREMFENPPKYIFIETRLIKPTSEKDPGFIDFLNTNYTIHSTGNRGSFYERKNR